MIIYYVLLCIFYNKINTLNQKKSYDLIIHNSALIYFFVSEYTELKFFFYLSKHQQYFIFKKINSLVELSYNFSSF